MKLFDYRTNHLILDGEEVTCWGKGNDVLKISRRANSASDSMGVDGRMTVSLNGDKSIKVDIKVMQTSPDNARLSKLARGQDTIETFKPITMRWQDSYRQDTAEGSVGYIEKHADVERGGEATEVEWTIYCERGDLLLGDPGFAGLATVIAENQGG